DQLRYAGQSLIEWRDFRRPWRREPFDRDAEITVLIRQTEELARIALDCNVPGNPVRYHLQPVIDFTSRLKRSEEIGRRDADELEALLVRLLGRLREEYRKGGRKFSPAHQRDEVIAIHDRLVADLEGFAVRADADLAALLQAEMQDLIALYEDFKARSGKV